MERIQTVVFVRHAVALHNVAIDPSTGKRPCLSSPSLFDPPLLTDGKIQAVQAGAALQSWWNATHAGEPIELIVTSPLTRCIQTATLAFLPGDDDYTRPAPRMMCHDDVREAYGMHYPDRRREKSILQVGNDAFVAEFL